jgi:hypothetical protein
VLSRLAVALGGRLCVWIDWNTGTLVHDHHQARMLDEVASSLHARWRPSHEVPVYEPVTGVIDLVLEEVGGRTVVAAEAQSALRRIEQQVRWGNAKADALAEMRGFAGGGTAVSRLLLLRSTASTIRAVATYPDLIGSLYPARHADAVASLTLGLPWPGSTLVWMSVTRKRAAFLDLPPPGIRVGR